MQYIQLEAGDIRQKGDEVLHVNPGKGAYSDEPHRLGYVPVRLVGHKILSADLISATFHRPVK